MAQMIKLAKVTTIPTTLEKNTMYLLKNASDKLEISLTDSTGANAIALSSISSYNDLTDKPSVVLTADKGIANGVADLDANVKIPLSRLPDSILGQLEYQGPYDMATALPTASSSNKGWYYIASNATMANGYVMGDWAVSNGTSWDKIDNTDAVQSVAGRTGAVVLGISDVTNLQTTLDAKAPLSIAVSTNTTLTASDNGKRVRVTAGVTVPTTAFVDGNSVVVYNDSAASITITMTGFTAYLDGVNTSKTSFTLATRGTCAIMFNSATSAVLIGKSVS